MLELSRKRLDRGGRIIEKSLVVVETKAEAFSMVHRMKQMQKDRKFTIGRYGDGWAIYMR